MSTPPLHNISATSASCMVLVALVLDFINLLILGLIIGAVLGLYGATFVACTGGHWFDCAVGAIGSGVTSVATAGALLMFGPLLSAIVHAGALFIAGPLFWGWFYFRHHYNTLGIDQKKLLLNLGTGFIELIPLVSILPGITLNVVLHIRFARKEDRATRAAAASRPQLRTHGVHVRHAYA